MLKDEPTEENVIDYFEVPGMPDRYFACRPYGTMSPQSCARNFKEAPQAFQSGRLGACIACHVGCRHARGDDASGERPARMTNQLATACLRVCLRCRRSGQDAGSRLIGRMRLIRGHSICVSCYNREREVLRGKNAKGAPPKKWAGLFFTQLSYVKDAQTHWRTALTAPVFDRIEAALLMLRRGGAQSVFFAGRAVVRLRT
jgi:hypothetical protein